MAKGPVSAPPPASHVLGSWGVYLGLPVSIPRKPVVPWFRGKGRVGLSAAEQGSPCPRTVWQAGCLGAAASGPSGSGLDRLRVTPSAPSSAGLAGSRGRGARLVLPLRWASLLLPWLVSTVGSYPTACQARGIDLGRRPSHSDRPGRSGRPPQALAASLWLGPLPGET